VVARQRSFRRARITIFTAVKLLCCCLMVKSPCGANGTVVICSLKLVVISKCLVSVSLLVRSMEMPNAVAG
jgi:hypothetical protein